MASVQAWLADRHAEVDTFCQLPQPSHLEALTWLMTIASIVMDLIQRTMWINDGPSRQ